MDMISKIYSVYLKKKGLSWKQQKSFYRKFIELGRDELTEISKKGRKTMRN